MAMTSKQVLKTIVEKTGLKKAMVAARLGISPQSLNGRIQESANGKDLTVALASVTARACDYKIVFVPTDTKLKEGWYEVE